MSFAGALFELGRPYHSSQSRCSGVYGYRTRLALAGILQEAFQVNHAGYLIRSRRAKADVPGLTPEGWHSHRKALNDSGSSEFH